MSWGRNLMKVVLGSALLVGAIPLASQPVQARERNSCSARLRTQERDLNRAIRRYGYHSRQAQRERNELRRVERHCRGRW